MSEIILLHVTVERKHVHACGVSFDCSDTCRAFCDRPLSELNNSENYPSHSTSSKPITDHHWKVLIWTVAKMVLTLTCQAFVSEYRVHYM